MPLVLNMPEFWIYQTSEYTRVTQGLEYAWIIPEFVLICLIMSRYVWIYLNMLNYANEHGAIFLKRQKLIFSVADGSISFVFCFRLNIFTSKIWICCYLSGLTGRKWCWGSWILIYPSSVLFFLSQNWYRNPYDPIFVK